MSGISDHFTFPHSSGSESAGAFLFVKWPLDFQREYDEWWMDHRSVAVFFSLNRMQTIDECRIRGSWFFCYAYLPPKSYRHISNSWSLLTQCNAMFSIKYILRYSVRGTYIFWFIPQFWSLRNLAVFVLEIFFFFSTIMCLYTKMWALAVVNTWSKSSSIQRVRK